MPQGILQSTVRGARRRGKQGKRWEDDVREWDRTGLCSPQMDVEDRSRERDGGSWLRDHRWYPPDRTRKVTAGLETLKRWSSQINVFKVMITKTKWPTVAASLMRIACLRCRENSTLNDCLCRPTMTLHQGQGHRHEEIYHACVYRHANFECHSLNSVRDMAIIVQVKHLSCLRRTCDLERRAI